MAATKGKDYVLRLNGIQEERRMVAPICKTHFGKQPMKIARGMKQYVFDDQGKSKLNDSLCSPIVSFDGLNFYRSMYNLDLVFFQL